NAVCAQDVLQVGGKSLAKSCVVDDQRADTPVLNQRDGCVMLLWERSPRPPFMMHYFSHSKIEVVQTKARDGNNGAIASRARWSCMASTGRSDGCGPVLTRYVHTGNVQSFAGLILPGMRSLKHDAVQVCQEVIGSAKSVQQVLCLNSNMIFAQALNLLFNVATIGRINGSERLPVICKVLALTGSFL